MQAIAQAQPNIALIKYWGKKDVARNLPAVGSISITLDTLWTRMSVQFCDKAEHKKLSESHDIIERYDSFVLIRASAAESKALSRRYPVEDITDQFKINIRGRAINTNQSRIDAQGRQH